MIERSSGILAPETRFPARRAGNKALFALAAAMIFSQMDAVLMSLLIEPIKHEIQLTDAQLGVVLGLGFGLGLGVGAIPFGIAIDRLSRLWLLRISLLGFVGAMVMAAFAGGFIALFAAEVVIGAVISVMGPAATSLVADFFPPNRRGLGAGILATSQLSGQAMAYLLGGWLVDELTARSTHVLGVLLPSPWRTAYLIFALLSLTALPGLFLLREPARQETTHRRLTVVGSFRQLLKYREFLVPLFVAVTFTMAAYYAVQTWIAVILMRQYSLSAGQVGGWLGAVFLCGGVLGSLLAGRLAGTAQRKGRNILSSAAIASLMLTPLAFLALTPSPPWVAAFLGGIVLLSIIAQVTSMVAIIMLVPNELRGLCIGIYNVLGLGVGRILAPSSVILVSGAFSGPNAIGLGVGIVAATSSLLAAALFRLAGTREAAAGRTDHEMLSA